MGLSPSSKSNPTTVSRFLDTGYDNVKKVADNIEDINSISNSIDIINQEAITQVEVIGQGYVDQAEAAKVASEQAASDSQGYSVTAINAKNESIVQAGIATDKANEALQSANESATQAGIATTQANSAINSANAAATSEGNALSSSNLAESWATNGEDILVDGTEYSAKHYSIKASASAAQASLDAQTISDQLDSTYLKAESDLRYFQVSNNLSEVDPTQGRSNLGLGTVATKDVGSSANEIPDKAILDVRLATTGNLGDSATKNIGSNVGEVPDKAVLDTRLGTTGNLGTAATRNVGESAGNVLEVGAFGIGSTTTLFTGNISTLTNSGLYWYGTEALNKPTASDGHLLNISRLQGISANISMVKNVPEIYIQNTNLSTEWFKSYSSYNILGTVSESVGVPTGAIIEKGSNINGEYTKFADGTLICTGKITTGSSSSASGTVFRSEPSSSGLYASQFLTAPEISITNITSTKNSFGAKAASTTTGYSSMRAYAGTGADCEDVTLSYIAIGKWF